MDLLTHVLVAYLLTAGIVGLHPQYLAAGALAGGLPDADALFFPLARRFPLLRHHGITHSVFGVSVIAVAGAFLAPLILPGSPLLYFVVMEVGGLAHVLQDGFTQFSVPPLAPFSDKRLQMDADRAVNFITLIVSAVGFYVLLDVERNRVTYDVYTATLWVLVAFFVAYFGIRLAGRLAIGRRLKELGELHQPVPTSNPFVWLVLSEERRAGRLTTRYARYELGRGITVGPFVLDVPLEADPTARGPVASAREALERSYPLARTATGVLDQTYHFGSAEPRADGGWTAEWYSLEFTAFGRAAGARVTFAPDGTASVRSGWSRVRPQPRTG